MNSFFNQELNVIPGKKIVTYFGHFVRGDFDMIEDKITSTTYKALKSHMKSLFTHGGAITVRRFTDQTDEETQLPIKYVRIYAIKDGNFIRIPADEVQEACCTDTYTGKDLGPEKSVLYE